MAFMLLEKDKTRKLGVRSRRKKAGWDRDCLLTVPGIGQMRLPCLGHSIVLDFPARVGV